MLFNQIGSKLMADASSMAAWFDEESMDEAEIAAFVAVMLPMEAAHVRPFEGHFSMRIMHHLSMPFSMHDARLPALYTSPVPETYPLSMYVAKKRS